MARKAITAQNQYTDWIEYEHPGAINYQILLEGDRSNGSDVVVEAQRHKVSGSAAVTITTIASTDPAFWLGLVYGPIRVRAGCPTGGFGAGDAFTIDLG